jgi:hypothetical protein
VSLFLCFVQFSFLSFFLHHILYFHFTFLHLRFDLFTLLLLYARSLLFSSLLLLLLLLIYVLLPFPHPVPFTKHYLAFLFILTLLDHFPSFLGFSPPVSSSSFVLFLTLTLSYIFFYLPHLCNSPSFFNTLHNTCFNLLLSPPLPSALRLSFLYLLPF